MYKNQCFASNQKKYRICHNLLAIGRAIRIGREPSPKLAITAWQTFCRHCLYYPVAVDPLGLRLSLLGRHVRIALLVQQ